MTGDPLAFTKALARIAPEKLLPATTLYVHVSAEDLHASTGAEDGSGTQVARVEGIGPVTLTQVVALLGHTNVSVKPVIDLNANHPVDGYEVPVRMREQLQLRSPHSAYPWSGNTSRRKDLEHTEPYVPRERGGPPGQTRVGNLGPLERRAHRLKTFARGWRHHQPVPACSCGAPPHGYWFRVDHTGTHQLGKSPSVFDLDGGTIDPRSAYERALAELLREHAAVN